MFDDARKLQQLFNDIKFGFQTISDNPAVDGNQVRINSINSVYNLFEI